MNNIIRLIWVGMMFITMPTMAAHVIDLYGYTGKNKDIIIKKYSKTIETMVDELQHQMTHPDTEHSKRLEVFALKKNKLSTAIKQETHALYVDFNTVFYPGNPTAYTTIEVIDKQDPERLRFVRPDRPPLSAKPSKTHDVIDDMIRYTDIGMQLAFRNKALLQGKPCPVYHCVWGFNARALKPFLQRFNTGVIHEKKLIEWTLKHDQSPKRRAAAALLVGHYTDAKSIYTVLVPRIADKDDGVRNNAMRVLGATLATSPVKTFDIAPLLSLLDSPYETDRNKALFMLFQVVQSDKIAKRYLIHHGENALLSLLALKQPNNHELAYLILKQVSGQDFGEYNLTEWRHWLRHAKQTRVS